MATVGRIAGVSQVTVSRALSDPSKVSSLTLKKIEDAIHATGFVPNALAGALASQQSHLVSALVPSLTNIVYSSVVKTFSQRMREFGYQILLSETGFDLAEEEVFVSGHLSRQPDAVLLTGIQHSAQTRRMLLGAGIPIVEVWDITASPIDMCVGFSHADAGRAVADFAIDAGFAFGGTVTANDERAKLRRDSFTSRFLQKEGQSVSAHDCPGAASMGAGRAALADLIDNQGLKSGIVFCSSDVLAQGLLIEAHARGLKIPGDLSIVGFGDQEFAKDLEPALTTVRVDRELLGRTAADAILARIMGTEFPQPVSDLGFEIVRRMSA
ncbi:LacI family DNA-binding transcriptional regulator [Pararhizobium sp. IMCC21322]|uniref:LacI family DNA-binding transcriptional regulator n=1 Tax=Pararhizobium sp. IMCC21322 TaxID=3067903 RepID=UPI0027425891|nr:LacI family DNA-binding transcriptional regulator [Pararhizobium sp. IMCC21322]